MGRLLAKLEPLRRWIDGDNLSDSLQALDSHARPRCAAEEFLVRVTREVALCMSLETFTPPGCPTYIPRTFILFLSKEDDSEWQGTKRQGLEQGIAHGLRQRTKELFGQSKLDAQTFTVDLRVDGTLSKGEFYVKAAWDSEANRTSVSPREVGNESEKLPPADNETTVVNSRPRVVLYSIEVLRNGVGQNIFPVTKPEITIGRGSQTIAVDMPISGDHEISRLHAIITRDAQGLYRLIVKGQNPVFVNEREVKHGEQAEIAPGDDIKICSFTLRIHGVAKSAD